MFAEILLAKVEVPEAWVVGRRRVGPPEAPVRTLDAAAEYDHWLEERDRKRVRQTRPPEFADFVSALIRRRRRPVSVAEIVAAGPYRDAALVTLWLNNLRRRGAVARAGNNTWRIA